MSTIVPTHLTHFHPSLTQQKQARLTPFRLCLFLLVAMLVLVGCGPEEGEGSADVTAETVRIAQAYQQGSDLGSARADLDNLAVANPTQFLILLAEERAKNEPGTPETNALVHFALALGLQSGQLMSYAVEYGLLANTVAPTSAVVAQPASQSLAPVTSAEQAPAAAPTAAPPSAPVASSEGTTPTDVTTTDVTTKTLPVAVVVEGNGQGAATAPASQDAPAVDSLPTATPGIPTATPVTNPQVQASSGLNVRGGPGTAYPIVGALASGQQAEIIAKNPEGDWWQVAMPGGGTGWVYGPLVQTSGDTASIAVASNIPPAPPTPTPAPVAAAPTQPAQTPAEQPTETPPTVAPPAEVPPGNDFYAVERRLWTVEETGGSVDSGGSVRCGEKRELVVIVLDANGNRLNGVAVQAIYGAQEIFVTGAQGKGDGQAEFVLGEGQGVKIIRDADGREVTSDVIDGMTTQSPKIGYEDLIAARYCTDQASCDKFNSSAGCWGHHSWTATFKRKY